MGAKDALLAFGDIKSALRSTGPTDQSAAEALVTRLHPDRRVEPSGPGALDDSLNPADDTTYAVVLPNAELLCDWKVIVDEPTDLPQRVHELAAGRRITMHAMHSVADVLAFGLWDNGEPVRFLNLSPAQGIVTNIGEPLDFEVPFWAGEHPVNTGGWPDAEPCPLPFHPLELGEAALRALFGFVIEGFQHPDDINTEMVQVQGFRVFDSTGREQAEREAATTAMLAQMKPPRRYTVDPDGAWREITPAGG